MAICHYGEKAQSFPPAFVFLGAFSTVCMAGGCQGAPIWSGENYTGQQNYCVCPINDKKMDSIRPSANRLIQLKGGFEKSWTWLYRRKKHLHARIAHTTLCGCSNITDVILSILNGSLCGQNLIESQENTLDLPANAILHISKEKPSDSKQELCYFLGQLLSSTFHCLPFLRKAQTHGQMYALNLSSDAFTLSFFSRIDT